MPNENGSGFLAAILNICDPLQGLLQSDAKNYERFPVDVGCTGTFCDNW